MKNSPNSVVIVGGSFGRDDAKRFQDTQSEIWCVANIYDKVPYATRVFDMHQDGNLWTKNTYKAYDDKKLILQHPEALFPHAQLLPIRKLTNEFGHVFTSSFSWMSAYAIHLNVQRLSLYGVNMIHKSELGLQRDGLLFLLGYAKARGIAIETPQKSYLRYGVRL